MDQVIKLVKDDLATVSTGRARPALIEDIRVEAYPGTWLTLKELATIAAPDLQTLTLQIWDQSVVEPAIKAIQAANLGLNPVADQNQIRLHVPPLTEERRQELVKAVNQKIESARGMLRQVRNDLKKTIDEQKNQPGVSEDDIHQAYESLQRLVDEFGGELDRRQKSKEQELTSW